MAAGLCNVLLRASMRRTRQSRSSTRRPRSEFTSLLQRTCACATRLTHLLLHHRTTTARRRLCRIWKTKSASWNGFLSSRTRARKGPVIRPAISAGAIGPRYGSTSDARGREGRCLFIAMAVHLCFFLFDRVSTILPRNIVLEWPFLRRGERARAISAGGF